MYISKVFLYLLFASKTFRFRFILVPMSFVKKTLFLNANFQEVNYNKRAFFHDGKKTRSSILRYIPTILLFLQDITIKIKILSMKD